MEKKSFLFNARRLEVNNYITIIECGEKRMSFCWGLGLMEKHSLKWGIGFSLWPKLIQTGKSWYLWYLSFTYKVNGLVTLCCSHSVVSDSCDPRDCSPPGSYVHGIFPGKNTEVGCHLLLQGTFPTQGLNQSPVSPALEGRFSTIEPPRKPG